MLTGCPDTAKGIVCYVIDGKELYLDHSLIERVLVEQDFPLLYVCTDNEGKMYLCLCIDPDDGEYLVAETDYKNIGKLKAGRIPIREAFKHSKKLIKVFSRSNNINEDICQTVNYEDLSDDDLPKEGVCLMDTEEIEKRKRGRKRRG